MYGINVTGDVYYFDLKRMKRILHPVTVLMSVLSILPGLAADDTRPLLHPLFSDHSVLQRGQIQMKLRKLMTCWSVTFGFVPASRIWKWGLRLVMRRKRSPLPIILRFAC